MEVNTENFYIDNVKAFSLLDVINGIKKLKNFVIIYFWRILLLSVIGAVLGFYFAYRSKDLFNANVKFIMKESTGTSALLSSLGSLGSLVGGGVNSSSPLDRTLAILNSERIVGSSLFKLIKIDGKSDLAINHFIKIYQLDDKWKDDTLLKNVFFEEIKINPSSLSLAQRKAYKTILNYFIGENSQILSVLYEKKSGVFDISIKTLSESFSIEFSKILYYELEKFMYEQSATVSGKNVSILSNKIDSIKVALNEVQNSLARNTDRTLGLLMQEDKVSQKKLIMKEQMLTIMYGEAQKNLETFKFMDESVSTGLEIIESPLSPIKPIKKSVIKFALIGFFLMGSISFSFFYLYSRVKNIL